MKIVTLYLVVCLWRDVIHSADKKKKQKPTLFLMSREDFIL